jgi:anhydro-N-acetylmuramic acid kinase
MTGTSLDGLDAALVEIQGTGLEITARFCGMVSRPLGELKNVLGGLAAGTPAAPLDYLRAARRLGELHAEAVEELIRQPDASGQTHHLDLVVAHGQTIWHAPDASAGAGAGMSWQLLDPWPIVRRLGVPVCYDLRQADLIAGGQGAPLTPLSDWIMYRCPERPRLIVNLGGICNVTRLSANGGIEQFTGEDIGPCNILIDGVVRRAFPGTDFDRDGRLAAAGGASSIVYRLLQNAPFFARKSSRPKSTGREDFNAAWLDELVQSAGLKPHDLVASAVEAVARLIGAEASRQTAAGPLEIILAGGGVRNHFLVRAIRSHCPPAPGCTVKISDDLGIPCEAREAMAFAVLGALSQDGVPISLPQVTGSTHPGRAGAWALP